MNWTSFDRCPINLRPLVAAYFIISRNASSLVFWPPSFEWILLFRQEGIANTRNRRLLSSNSEFILISYYSSFWTSISKIIKVEKNVFREEFQFRKKIFNVFILLLKKNVGIFFQISRASELRFENYKIQRWIFGGIYCIWD